MSPQTIRGNSFLVRARQLETQGRSDASLDVIYDAVDEHFKKGRFDEVDHLLREIDVSNYSTDILIAVLTATAPARSRLPSRAEFFKRVESETKTRLEFEEGLLDGLDG